MKRLVVLSDGTWESANDPRTGPRSNVVLLSRLIPHVGTGGVPPSDLVHLAVHGAFTSGR